MLDLKAEKQLVDLAKKDIEAFGRLYEVYFGKIYSYVVYLVGNNQKAEDIVSETFEKAMLNINKFEYRGYSFGAWLYKIARNLVYDNSKKTKEFLSEEIEIYIGSEEYNPEKIIDSEEMNTYLSELLTKLKPEQKEVVYLRYVQQYSIKEVCSILNKSEDSIKSLSKRGLEKLKKLTENGR